MGFVQIIEYSTSKLDEMRALGDEWEAAAKGQATATRRVLCEDRDKPGRFLNIVFFGSYEDAMANSNLPTTTEFAERMMALADGPATFRNLDVVDESVLSDG